MAKKAKHAHKSLSKRYGKSYETRNQGGGGSQIFRWRDLDKDIEFFSPNQGRNAINIIPFEIKTKNHPLVRKGDFEIGDMDYVMDIWTHRGIGPSESAVLCLKKTFGKPCPICEEADRLKKAGKDKEASELKSSRRVIYNVEDVKHPGKALIFETSHFLFEKELIDEAREGADTEGFVEFANADEGKTIKFRASKISRGGFEFNEYKSFSFVDREEPLDDDLLAAAVAFDEIMNVPSYEDAQKILFGADDDEEDEDEEDDDEERPVRKGKGKKPARDEDEDDDESDDDEEDDEPAPKKGKSKPIKKGKAKRLVRDEEDEEDDPDEDDEDEDEEPTPKKGKKVPAKKTSGKCPFKHHFGEDCDEYEDCDDCDSWDKCAAAKK
jgi:hypothetical protein